MTELVLQHGVLASIGVTVVIAIALALRLAAGRDPVVRYRVLVAFLPIALLAAFAWVAAGSERPPLAGMLPALCGALLLALPGLVPAVWLTRGVDADLPC